VKWKSSRGTDYTVAVIDDRDAWGQLSQLVTAGTVILTMHYCFIPPF